MSFAKLSHRQQHTPILLNNFNTNAAPTGLLKTSPSSNSSSSTSSNSSKIIKKPMPQMPTNLQHGQFLTAPHRQSNAPPGSANPLGDFSAAFAAAYPTPFGPMNPQSEAAALAMFSQLQHQQNAPPGQDPRAFANPQSNPNYAMAVAYAAQYCNTNDPISASMLVPGSYPYGTQGPHGNQIPPQIFQNLIMNSQQANSAPQSSHMPSSQQQHSQEGSGSTRRKNATRETTATLKAWLYEHRKNPYPTKAEKIMLACFTRMSLNQVSTWFANARRRLKKENKMTFSPRNRTAEDIDSDDETQSKSKNGKKNGSTSSDNMNFDDLDDLDDIDNEELEGCDEDEDDSFSFSNEKRQANQPQSANLAINANKNLSQQQQMHLTNSIKHGMGPGMLNHHGHHPYFNSQQLTMHQHQLQQQQQQQNAQYLQSLFQPGHMDANKMMSIMLQSSGAFNSLQSPINNNHEQQQNVKMSSPNCEKKDFTPPSKPSPTHQQQPPTGSNKNGSTKPKIWSLADVATNNPTPPTSISSKQQKSLNTSLSSLSSSSLSSSSSSNSSTTNYYAPISPKLATATQPLNINASNALTPNSTAPLSNSSSSQQNQSPKSSLSTNSNESSSVTNNTQLLSQQHQQLLSFFAAAAAQQAAGFQLPFLAMQQAMAKSQQQKESTTLDSEKDENSDEENCQNSVSLETTGSEINNRSNVTDVGDENEGNDSKNEEELSGKEEKEDSAEKESDDVTASTPQKRRIENDDESGEETEACEVSAKRKKTNII